MKEYTYNISDLKGSINLIEDCKNHLTYCNTLKSESDLDVILNGINSNMSNVDIIKQLPNVTCDNVYSIYNGIKCIRNDTPVNEELAFKNYFLALLNSFGFDFDKMLNCSKAHIKAEKYVESYQLLIEVVEMFVKFCQKSNYDIIDILLKD